MIPLSSHNIYARNAEAAFPTLIIIQHRAEYKLKIKAFAVISLNFHFGFTAFTLLFSVNSAFTGIIKA